MAETSLRLLSVFFLLLRRMVSLKSNPATDPGSPNKGGAWVAEHVLSSKFNDKIRLEATRQKAAPTRQ